jgi:integrase
MERKQDRKHLKLRHHTWFCRMVVPARHRAAIGQRELMVTLRTRDLRVAQRRRAAALAQMQATIDRAARGQSTVAPAGILGTALAIREQIRSGSIGHEEASHALHAAVERELDSYEKMHGVDDEGYPRNMPPHAVEAIRQSHNVVDGHDVTLLSEEVATYLSAKALHVTPGTLRAKARTIAAFQAWLKTDMDAASVSRVHARNYLSEDLLKRGASPATIKKVIFTLSALWVDMELNHTVTANIWTKLSTKVRESKRGSVAVRRPWTDAELTDLLPKFDTGDVLIPLTVLGAFAGMREEEICSLKLKDVTMDALNVTEGKSAASVRYVPLVPMVRPMVARLVAMSTDGYLLSGLLSGGVDNRRSHNVSKRFGRAIRAFGFTDTALCFHTLRNSFAQKMERAGVRESTAKLIIGHERGSITYGLYSKGVDTEALQQAVAGVSYGAAVDAFVAGLSDFTLTTESRRRPSRVST